MHDVFGPQHGKKQELDCSVYFGDYGNYVTSIAYVLVHICKKAYMANMRFSS
jgi:hypothetical protein